MVISKSAYSLAGKTGKFEGHTIVVWVDNEAGVLARVVGFFSGRGYNIDSLAVAEVEKKNNLSRITFVTKFNIWSSHDLLLPTEFLPNKSFTLL